jgi:3-deoxy-D-manno-octulosonate 8-phosphate phosphatase (KDO 8-P phosphatase)
MKNIKLAVFDIDGVFTSGNTIYNQDGSVSKAFHDHDSYSLHMLRNAGVKILFISADTRVNQKWAEHQNVEYICSNNKLNTLKEYLRKAKILPKNVMYMGDDIRDRLVMEYVGFPFCPQNANHNIRNIAIYSTKHNGGDGAVREAVEYLLTSEKSNK